jgi:uncharacterized OB-fold protein
VDSTTTLETRVEREPEAETSPLEPLTTELASPMATPSETCPSCGARMAPDQRYCIECGERRSGGGLRDAMPRTQTAAVAAAPPRRPRFSANSSLIAGIATLLIAMGVGVLIGRTGDDGSKAAGNSPVQVVTVPNGAAAAGAAAAGSTGSSAAKAAKKAKSKKAKASSGGGAQQTASENNVKLPPPVVKVGGKCTTKGAKGCEGGKFTGNFFGQ